MTRSSLRGILCVFALSFLVIPVQADVMTETFVDYSNDISYYDNINSGNIPDNTTDKQEIDAQMIDILQVVLFWNSTSGVLNITYTMVSSISLDFMNSSGLIVSVKYSMDLTRLYNCVIDSCDMDLINFEAKIQDGVVSTLFTDSQTNENSTLDYSIANNSISLSGMIRDHRSANLLQRKDKGNYMYGFGSQIEFKDGMIESAEDQVSQDYTIQNNFQTSFTIGQDAITVVVSLFILVPLVKRKSKIISSEY